MAVVTNEMRRPGRGGAAVIGRDDSAEAVDSHQFSFNGIGGNRLPMLAAQIGEAHDVVGRSVRCAVEAAVEAGNRLNEAKALLPHGQWIPWLRKNVPGLTPRTAQRYMRAADVAAKNDTVSHSTIKALIAKPRPPVERMARIGDGLVLVLTPSTSPGFTHVAVIDFITGDTIGFRRPADVRGPFFVQMLDHLLGDDRTLPDLGQIPFHAHPCEPQGSSLLLFGEDDSSERMDCLGRAVKVAHGGDPGIAAAILKAMRP
jgi:hypothetical protein